MNARLALSLTVLLLLAAASGALEKTSPEAMRRRTTSGIEENSSRPLYLFAMRGRPDPFVPFMLNTARRESAQLAISELAFTGYIGTGADSVALFSHRLSGTNYSLRGSRLYGADNKPIEDVRGRVLPNRDVRLQQGNRSIVYSAFQGRSR